MNQKLLSIALIAAFLGACAPFSSPPEPSNVEADDARISADIAMRYHDAGLDGRENVKILVTDGRVDLEGTLGSQEDIRVAIDLAKEVSGVESVSDRLAVDDGGDG